LDAADDILPARLTCYLEKQGFSRVALEHFVQLADPNALEPVTRIIANNYASVHYGFQQLIVKIITLMQILDDLE
jgi:hypothetical protein